MHKLVSILLIGCFFLSFALQAQILVTGQVAKVDGTPIDGAHVIFNDQAGQIVSFAFTDSLGAFALELTTNDSIHSIRVSHLSYITVEMRVVNLNEFIVVTLEPGRIELPEVKIKVDPIIRRGDTLIFDVDSYTRDDDRTLEDVLSRLPGIAIEPSGKILYRGLPISKLYIEGLDMLEGRYKIATQNLSLHHILDIEIIERHQHKQVLRGIENTEQAAINIKLKSKVAFTGSLAGGLASGSPDYSLRGDLFGFTKSFQFVGIASSNTLGLSERATFADLQHTLSLYEYPMLTINSPRTPWQIAPQSYQDNDEQVIGGMGLIKISDDDVLKWYTTYTRDGFSYGGSEDILFDLPGVPVLSQRYNYHSTFLPDSWSSHAIYEKNSECLFIKSKNAVDVSQNNDLGENTYNGSAVSEEVSNRIIEGKSANEIIFRLPNKAITFYMDLSYKKLEESLHIDTVDLITIDSYRSFANLNQSVDRAIAQGHLWTRLLRRVDNATIFAKTGVRGLIDGMNSTLDPSVLDLSLGDSFKNNQSLHQISPYIDLSYVHDFGLRKLTVGIPMRWLVYELKDKIRKSEASARPFLYSFNAGYSDISSTKFNWQLNYSFRDEVESLMRPIHSGFILYSNRSLSQSILDFNRISEHKIDANVNYLESSSNKSYNIGIEYTIGQYEFLAIEQFDLRGSTDIQIKQPNAQSRFKIDINSKGALARKLDYFLKGQMIWTNSLRGSNGQLFTVDNKLAMLDFKLSYLIGHSILTFHPEWLLLNSNTSSYVASRSQYRLKYYASFSDFGAVRVDGGIYINAVSTTRNYNTLINVEWEKEWKKSRTTLTLEINNISNASGFVTVEQYFNTQQLFTLGLQTLQVRLRFRKNW